MTRSCPDKEADLKRVGRCLHRITVKTLMYGFTCLQPARVAYSCVEINNTED